MSRLSPRSQAARPAAGRPGAPVQARPAQARSSQPRRRSHGALFFQTVGVVMLFFISIGVLFTVLQVTGLWDWFNPLTRRLAQWPVLAPHVEMYRLGRAEWGVLQDEQARLARWELELRAEAERLAEEQRQLRNAQNELDAERARLDARERELEARRAAVERLEDEHQALQRLREVYQEMRPQEAARILADMSDEEVTVLLADMDPRTVAAILAAFPADKAASVSRRLGL